MIGKMNLRALIPTEMGEMVTNLRPDVPSERQHVGRALAPSDGDLKAFVNQTVDVIGVVMNMAEMESMAVKGEMVQKPYAQVILADGKMLGTTSGAIVTYLAFLIGAMPPGLWEPAIRLEIRAHQSKGGKTYYSARQALEVPAAQAAKKGGKS
jgi:hypothetical protein